MLIESDRPTRHDMQVWHTQARYDRATAGSSRLDRLERDAIAAIHAWAGDGPGVVSTSWGKDSVVVAHIAMTAGIRQPIVWVRSDPFETPECEQVRDQFLQMWPEAAALYSERSVPLRNPKRGEPGHATHHLGGGRGQDVLGECITEPRHMSGVRAQESRVRDISIASRGLVTTNTCRPIGRWTGPDVFAYLTRHQLPIHPVYAMTLGGVLDRQWVRTHPLCQHVKHTKTDVAHWEDTYYRDVITAALNLRAAWRANGDPRGGTNPLLSSDKP